jgi:biotin carboxyl carrier protein
MRYRVNLDGQSHELELESQGRDQYVAKLGSGADARSIVISVLSDKPSLAVLIEGRVVELIPLGPHEASARGARSPAQLLDAAAARRARAASAGNDSQRQIRAPMPGRIVKVLVTPGQTVIAGQPAVVIEAMKMENELACGLDGSVTRVLVGPGDAVERGAVLVEFGS